MPTALAKSCEPTNDSTQYFNLLTCDGFRIAFIKQAKTPTLVVVGERDQGSTPEQSLEFWRGLRTVDTPTELVVYAGEGHHFNTKDSNDTLRRSAEWFAKYMPASSANTQAELR